MNKQNGDNSKETRYPLSHPQKRVWFVEKMYPGTSIYNIGGPVRIKGIVDFLVLADTLNILIQKNDALRLHFTEEDGEVKQYVSSYKRKELDLHDFSLSEDPEKAMEAWVDKVMKQPFELENNDLFYFALFRINSEETGYLAKLHHIIADGWSIKVGAEQASDIYKLLSEGGDTGAYPEYSYISCITAEKEYFTSDRFIKNRDFWMSKFKELPETVLNSGTETTSGNRTALQLNQTLSRRIKDFSNSTRYSLNTFFVGLFLIYLYKYTQQEDIVIGTPVLNRTGKAERNIFGMFTSTMPFRFKMDNNESVQLMLKRVNGELKNCLFNQKYPYDLLVRDLELKKKGYDGLFQVCVNYYNTKLRNDMNGLPVEIIERYCGNQYYLMQLIIKDWSDEGKLTLEIDYKTDYFSEEQINQIFCCLLTMLDQMLENPSLNIEALKVLDEKEEKRQLQGFNSSYSAYPGGKTITRLFEEQVERTPDKTAVSFEASSLTYSELNKKANSLARVLRQEGVNNNRIVGLMVSHSIEAVIGILAVIKAGGAYLPIDPEYPWDRIEFMLNDSSCKVLLTDCPTEKCGFEYKMINLLDKEIYSGEGSNLPYINKPEDLVYVIYTSGSTGKPKGVMIEHKGLVNYIWWAGKMYIRDESDAFALYSSLSFDLTVTSVFTPLIFGSRIYIYKDDDDEYVLYRIMRDKKASIVKLTPSHLSLLKDMDNRDSAVKRFIVGGEDLKVTLAESIHESFCGSIEIFNEYGPTETVVGCMIHKFDYGKDTGVSVPIGIPADNVQIYILDKYRRLLPAGSAGEMYISGDGVARGYLNRPELTEERFVSNPFGNGKREQSRLYRTGDLARFNSDGALIYLGRADYQVKIRGYRIELGEIEKQLLSHNSVKEAIVIDLKDEDESTYLCAYYVPDNDVGSSELRGYLLKQLPEYMVPMHFVKLKKIPLNVNGKADRKLLPLPEKIKQGYVGPGNNTEEKLLEIVSEVLNNKQLGMKDNFLCHGGDSIKAIQIAGRLKEAGLKIKVGDILSHPVVEEMAACIGQNSAIADDRPCEGTFKPTPIIKWFLSQGLENIDYYTQSILLDFKQDISPGELGLILDQLVKHHASLRINYNPTRNELYYNSGLMGQPASVEYFDLKNYGFDEQAEKISDLGAVLKSSIRIEGEIPLKAVIFDLGSQGRKILIAAHHLVVDGVSWRILLDDLARLYRQIKTAEKPTLPPKSNSMAVWSEKIEGFALEKARNETDYWNEILEYTYEFPSDYKSFNDCICSSNSLTISLDSSLTEKLMYSANNAYGTEPQELMVTALASAMFAVSRSNEIVMELEGHGREELFGEIDVSGTVGWFTSIYPVKLKQEEHALPGLIKSIKEQLRGTPNKGLGFGALRYISDSLSGGADKSVRFNFLGEIESMNQEGLFEVCDNDTGSESAPENHMTALVDINAYILENSLKVIFTYSTERFKTDTIAYFSQAFLNYLTDIIKHCSERQEKEYTPSDFNLVSFTQDELDGLINSL